MYCIETVSKYYLCITKDNNYLAHIILKENGYNIIDLTFNVEHGESTSVYRVNKTMYYQTPIVDFFKALYEDIDYFFFYDEEVKKEIKNFLSVASLMDNNYSVKNIFYKPKNHTNYVVIDNTINDKNFFYILEPNDNHLMIIVCSTKDKEHHLFNVIDKNNYLPKDIDNYLEYLYKIIYEDVSNDNFRIKDMFSIPDWITNFYEQEYLKII